MDWPGAAMVGTGLALLLLALIEGPAVRAHAAPRAGQRRRAAGRHGFAGATALCGRLPAGDVRLLDRQRDVPVLCPADADRLRPGCADCWPDFRAGQRGLRGRVDGCATFGGALWHGRHRAGGAVVWRGHGRADGARGHGRRGLGAVVAGAGAGLAGRGARRGQYAAGESGAGPG
ncbi:hypothetical protein G6F35_015511 [Rhizopus arrhizus]|nr:hypothetical protein G6F35_015511 [Rhizopus arrhizus]